MKHLSRIKSPGDLARFSQEELTELAAEIRSFLIEKVSKSGGHLGPNLGIVELSIALHRVFESPQDVMVYDTGHQSYVHKILTGRAAGFEKLRQRGGLAGYPSRAESEHDVIENSHASTALSWADGIARGFALQNQSDRTVVAVVGDGALTGGMSWEALNNIAASDDLKLVIVVNDNERSYSPTIGGVATYLSTLRATKGYEKFLDWGKQVLEKTPVVGNPIYETLHGMKKGIKDIVAPQGMFEDLGLKYLGPVDGHDIPALERALIQAKKFSGPVLVHAITEKGRGHAPALNDEAEKFHAVGVVDPETGEPLSNNGSTWTRVFSEALVEIGRERKDVVAITAAMLGPTGLDRFQAEFPERTFDVGIAEQHAVTFAAGLATEGYKPFATIYSTFLQRAYDQVVHDVAIQNLPVRFAIDRAGLVGADGPTHAGSFDITYLATLPNFVVMAPSDEAELVRMINTAVTINDRPSAFRYPRGNGYGVELPSIKETIEIGKARIIQEGKQVCLLSLGTRLEECKIAANELKNKGISTTIIDARFAKPLDEKLILKSAENHEVLITIEEGSIGGFGSHVANLLAENGIFDKGLKFRSMILPDVFIDQDTPEKMYDVAGLNAKQIAQKVLEVFFSKDGIRVIK